jgi:Mg-chelatase subunit ChlD
MSVGTKTNQCLSLLHALISNLSAQDRFSMLFFNSATTLALELTEMTPRGKASAVQALQGYEAEGKADVGEALSFTLDAAVAAAAATTGGEGGVTVVVITDGNPNVGVTDPTLIMGAVQK